MLVISYNDLWCYLVLFFLFVFYLIEIEIEILSFIKKCDVKALILSLHLWANAIDLQEDLKSDSTVSNIAHQRHQRHDGIYLRAYNCGDVCGSNLKTEKGVCRSK